MFTIVWSDFVFWFQLFIIQIYTHGLQYFCQKKELIQSFHLMYCIYLHFTKNATYWFSPLDMIFTSSISIFFFWSFCYTHGINLPSAVPERPPPPPPHLFWENRVHHCIEAYLIFYHSFFFLKSVYFPHLCILSYILLFSVTFDQFHAFLLNKILIN